MDIFGVLNLVGGLALFLFGMSAMGDGLVMLSGGRLEQILEKLTKKKIMAVLLDVMLPDENGCDIVRRLRANTVTRRLPVIMVTAKTSEMDMVKGLDDGADDYIKKPFSVMELLSRVKALLRRTREEGGKQLKVGAIQMDHDRHTVTADGKAVELTFKEYELLRYLMINAEMVLSRESIMRFVWGTEFEGETRTVDMHIKTLRQKLGSCGRQIGTVRNVGYVLQSAPEDTV